MRTALDSPPSSREASTPWTSCARERLSRLPISFKASQNGASSEIDVRWPPIVNDRLTGRGMAYELTR